MCVSRTRRPGLGRFNWDGDCIVHECIVPSSRPVAGSRSRKGYDIDVREFLVTARNEVVRRTLHRDLQRYVAGMPGGDWGLFTSRQQGSFDYRVRVIAAFVADTIGYRKKANDPWLFPDETLAVGAGDCEDRALLLASLLLAAGVSSFNVRVALGKLRADAPAARQPHDHVWVMYKNEHGRWTVVEPVPTDLRTELVQQKPRRGRKPTALEYVPHFLFNDAHLWSVLHKDNDGSFQEFVAREWSKLDPWFIGEVHKSIVEEALRDVSPEATSRLLRGFRRPVLGLFGPIVDDIDRRPYDPVEHFDNGYIAEGWQRVRLLLDRFRADNADLPSFALAAHAMADFYAHSSYAHFAKVQGSGSGAFVEPWAIDAPGGGLAVEPDYARGEFDLARGRFSTNPFYWRGTGRERAALWRGKIVSGRYAQEDDTQGGLLDHLFMEGVTWIPKQYLAAPGFAVRGSLPHHDEIAVDEAAMHPGHVLYSEARYRQQFAIRKNTAVRHVRQAFLDCLHS